jgi:hypothetical protein
MAQSKKRSTTQSSVRKFMRSEVEAQLRYVFADEEDIGRALFIRNDAQLLPSISEIQITLYDRGSLEISASSSAGYLFSKPTQAVLDSLRECKSSQGQLNESSERLLDYEHSQSVPVVDILTINSLSDRCRKALVRRIPRLGLEHLFLEFESTWKHSVANDVTNDEKIAFLTDIVMDLDEDGYCVLYRAPVDVSLAETEMGPTFAPVFIRNYNATQETASSSKRTKTE